MAVKWVTGAPPVSRGNESQMCMRGQRRAGTRHSPSPAPPVPQPLCRNGEGPGRPGGHLGRGAAVFCGGRGRLCHPHSTAVWRGGVGPGRSGRAERRGRWGLGRPRSRSAGSMTGLCLSCLLWVRPAAPAPCGYRGAPGRSGTAARWGPAVGSRSGADPESGRWMGLVAGGAGETGTERVAFALRRADWERGKPEVLGRDRLWGNPDREETGKDGRTPGRGWEDRNGSGTGRSPGDRVEQSGTQPGKAAAVGTRLRGARMWDRLGWGQGHWTVGGVSVEAVWVWGAWGLMPHDIQSADLAGGRCHSPVRGSATPLEGTGQTGGNPVCTECWGSAPTAHHQLELGPGAQQDARHWVGLSPQGWTQAS